MSWEVLHEDILDRTERLDVEGGYLVRSAWRRALGIGQDALDGSAMTFVPVVSAPAVPAALPVELPAEPVAVAWRATDTQKAYDEEAAA